MGGVEYQVTKVDPTDPHTKGAVYQVHKVSEEIAATLGGKVYRARIIKDPTDPAVAGKVYQIVLIGDPSDPAVKGKVYNAILTGGSEAVIVGPAVSPLVLPDAVAGELDYVKAYGGTEQNGTPTPDAPVDIVSNNGAIKYSKNLLDMSTENIVLGKYINNSGAVLDSGPNFYNSKYIPVVGGETYTWSTSSSIGYFSVMEYDSGYVFKRRTLFGSSSSSPAGTSGTVTLRSDTAFVLIGSNMDSVDITLDRIAAVDWQFEKGTSATAYKPYSPTGIYTDGTVETIEDTIGNTATAEMLLKVGDYQDVQSIIDGVVTRNVGIKVLDGTEPWIASGTYLGSCYTNIIGQTPSGQVICSHFQNASGLGNYSRGKCYKESTSFNLWYGDNRTTAVADLKQFLADQYAAGTPVIVIYPLATPTTESVAGQTLQVTGGDNTLEITQAGLTGLELEAEYEKEAE